MRNLLIISLFISLCILVNFDVTAQNHGGRKGQRNKRVVVVKKGHPNKYHRKNFVVVHKRQGRTIALLPNGYSTCVYKKNNYYFHGGYYYRHYNNSYQMMAPPIGIRIKVLPVGYKKVLMFGKPHFFYKGVYYKQVGNEYETVQPEVGTVVPDIPDEIAEQVELEGISYYEIADFLYKSVETQEGIQYEVVGEVEDETTEGK